MHRILVRLVALFLILCLSCTCQAASEKDQVFQEAQAFMDKEKRGRQYFKQAEELASKHKYKESIGIYQKAIENLDTFKHIALFNMAMAYKNLKQYQDSISTLLQVVPLLTSEKKEQHEQLIQVYRLIADQTSMLEKWDFAAYHYEKIRSLTQDKDPSVLINLAKVLLNWGEPLPLVSSQKLFQQILNQHPLEFHRDKKLSCDYGVVLAKVGEVDLCAAQLTRCRSDNAHDYGLHTSMGTRLSTSNPKQALRHLELVTSSPLWYSNTQLAAQVVYRIGLIYRALDRGDDEIQLYLDAVNKWNIFKHVQQRPQYLFRLDSGDSLPLIPWYHPEVYDLSHAPVSESSKSDASVSISGEVKVDTNYQSSRSANLAIHEYVAHIVSILESNFTAIQSEVLTLISTGGDSSNHSLPDMEGLVDKGQWSQIPIYRNGRKFLPLWLPEMLPTHSPVLLRVAEYIYKRFAKQMPLGAIEVSTLKGGTNLRSHCGPTNHKIRFHLGIQIPDPDHSAESDTNRSNIASNALDMRSTLEVAGRKLAWQQGRALAFDDSFEHAVRSPSAQDRIVLIVDVWHPMITAQQKQQIRKNFRYSTTDFS